MRRDLKLIDKIKLCVYLLTGKGDFKGTKSLYCEYCGYNFFTDVEPQTQTQTSLGIHIQAVYKCRNCGASVLHMEKWQIEKKEGKVKEINS